MAMLWYNIESCKMLQQISSATTDLYPTDQLRVKIMQKLWQTTVKTGANPHS